MRLYVHHYHLRPGGVRRVVELELSAVVRHGHVAQVVLLAGESASDDWIGLLRARLPVPCDLRVDAALGYVIENPRVRSAQPAHLDRVVSNLLPDARRGDVLWLHNPAIGRNHAAVAALGRFAAGRGLRLVFHHHDFWMDQRWHRWHDLRVAGARTIREVAATLAPRSARAVHLAINRRDAAVLRRHAGVSTAWLPNPVTAPPVVRPRETKAARQWLHQTVRVSGPAWLAPCRLLRRKNLAESLLLMRWFDPEATLVTTGGPSSASERPYARALAAAAERHRWPLRLGVLAGAGGHPDLPALLRAADTLVFTSVQEGFGLPYVEAAFAHRPLVCRLLPHVTDDLQAMGFRFPCAYEDVIVPMTLFDAARERRRQQTRYRNWVARLPPGVVPPQGGAFPDAAVAFSRLTLTAQLEVLALPPAASWAACRAHNPDLARLVERRDLRPMRRCLRAEHAWSPDALAARWWRAVAQARTPVDADAGERLQAGLIERFLAPQHQHPLLWSEQP